MTLLFITGFMGAGKTTLAKYLSHKWDIPHLDTDTLIAHKYKKTAAQQLVADPVTFRKRETDLLAELALLQQGVISLGGGAIENENTRKCLVALPVLFLNPGVEICWSRVQAAKQERPLAKSYEGFQQLYQKRLPLYREVCTWEISDNLSPANLLPRIKAMVSK